MKFIQIINKKYRQVLGLAAFISVIAVFISCDPALSAFEFDLPEAGSIADATPPTANFSATQSSIDYRMYNFSNLSVSATTYFWDFGDGNTSSSLDAVNTFPGEGTYTVTLKASDALGVESIFSMTVDVVEPEAPEAIVPFIREAGFEDNSPGSEECGNGNMDGRDCWRISGGTIFGITSSPVRSGSQGAKFDAGSNRVAYQALTVTPNTDYIVTIYYTIKTSPLGSAMRLAILGNAISHASEAEDAIIASAIGDNQDDANEYLPLVLSFNSGATDTIAIWIDSNNVAESRIDDVSIMLAE
jgi:PKD repeat protein